MKKKPYGLVVTQNNVPVDRAADYQKVLDSRWRTFDTAIEREVDFSVLGDAVSGDDYIVMEHKLNFVPAFQGRVLNWGATTLNKYDALGLWADKRYIYYRVLYFSGFGAPEQLTGRFFLRIYNIDPRIEYKAEIVQTLAAKEQSVPTIGAKVLNDTNTARGMSDEEISHYSLNTQAKAFGIQQTGTVEATALNGNELVITHDLGYPPTYFIAVLDETDPNNTKIGTLDPGSHGRAQANTIQVRIVGAQAVLLGKWAYLILKDPIEVAS